MELRHPQHRHLRATPSLPTIRLAPSPSVADAVRRADPFGTSRADALTTIWAASLGLDPASAVVAPGRDAGLAVLLACLLGPEDVVALAGPVDPALQRAILLPGARWVDVGRDFEWSLQSGALDRVLADQAAKVCVFCRPGPLGLPLDALGLVERALGAGLTVVVDEEYLAWAPSDAASAVALMAAHPDRLIVLRGMPEAGLGPLTPALLVGPRWSPRLRSAIPQELPDAALAGALAALAEPVSLAAAARAAVSARDALAARLGADRALHVASSAGPRLLVKRLDGRPLAHEAAASPWTDRDAAYRDAAVIAP